ncbi:MAG: adenosine kinase [Proteobacteria bacterium]|nr:adenosine kinase [Pseudomonadota bacterium]
MKKYDIYGIGNALVDMEFEVEEKFILDHSIDKGHMTLVEEERQDHLLGALGSHPLKRQCGGSAANTVIAVAQLGGKCFYSCKVANDAAGDFYVDDLKESGVDSNLASKRPAGTTGKCLVMVTKDAQRTMNTFLGITSTFSEAELVESALKESKYLYIEGYLVASPTGQKAAVKARELAHAHGVKIAITLSDPAMVKFFNSGMKEMIGPGVDLLFSNEEEAMTFAQTSDLLIAREALKKVAKTFVITRGENGAIIFDGQTFIDIEPFKVKAVDSNGAGDMFAGAFLYAITHGHTYASAGMLASAAASKVVSQYGPRLKWHQTQEVLHQIFKQN